VTDKSSAIDLTIVGEALIMSILTWTAYVHYTMVSKNKISKTRPERKKTDATREHHI
jgi:hypothetical protein